MLSDPGRLEGFPARVAAMRSRGMTWDQIAAETGRSERTCRRAADTPAYRATVTSTTRQARRLLAQLADEAVEELQWLLRRADDPVKLRVVENVLDRVGIGRRQDIGVDTAQVRRDIEERLAAFDVAAEGQDDADVLECAESAATPRNSQEEPMPEPGHPEDQPSA